MTVHFFIPGDPKGKERIRFTRDGKPYTPKSTKNYEEQIRLFYGMQWHGDPFPKGKGLVLTIMAMFPIPKSASKKARQGMLCGAIKPTGKPDADNIAKVFDAINKIAWYDDAQITALHVYKRYALEPGLDVYITEDDE